MRFLLRLLLSSVAILILSYVLPGVNVDSLVTALIVAITLGILNALVKPVLVLLTLPITIVTLGLFLLFLNALMILLASKFIDGFAVGGIFWAICFGILLSFLQSILHSALKRDKKG